MYGQCPQEYFVQTFIRFIDSIAGCSIVKFRVRTHLESPLKLWSVLESPGISLLTLSTTQILKCVTQKDLQDKIARVVEELKKTDSRLFYALIGVLGKWEMCP